MPIDLRRRMQFMRYDDRETEALGRLAPAVKEALPAALDAFYVQVRAFEETAKYFPDDKRLQGAKAKQNKHWEDIISTGLNDAYLARAETIGRTHARIGIEPRWVVGGYGVLLDGLIKALVGKRTARSWSKKAERAAREDLAHGVSALVKAALLDMDIIIATYLEAAEIERKRQEEASRRAEFEQQNVVDALAAALTALADGNLVVRLANPFASEYETLRSNFNTAVEKLEGVLKAVATNAVAIRSGTNEISAASDDLARRTEHQAASLEETAAALDQITSTVKRTSESAEHAQDVVSAAKADAVQSGEVVRQAVGAMSAIETSAKQVSQIIGVIDEIALQTNLLALNAGVEAARAGDAGRGFAVVATEVRGLAQRSAEAAKEIKALITTSAAQVGEGVDLVNATGKALERILVQVAEINVSVGEIAASTREQATTLGEINSAITQMDQVTQQNAAMVEESTAASHSLVQEAKQLGDLIDRFHLGGTAPNLRDRERSTPAKPVAAKPPSGKPSRPPVVAARTLRQGGALRKAEPAGAAQSWEEF